MVKLVLYDSMSLIWRRCSLTEIATLDLYLKFAARLDERGGDQMNHILKRDVLANKIRLASVSCQNPVLCMSDSNWITHFESLTHGTFILTYNIIANLASESKSVTCGSLSRVARLMYVIRGWYALMIACSYIGHWNWCWIEISAPNMEAFQTTYVCFNPNSWSRP